MFNYVYLLSSLEVLDGLKALFLLIPIASPSPSPPPSYIYNNEGKKAYHYRKQVATKKADYRKICHKQFLWIDGLDTPPPNSGVSIILNGYMSVI